MTLKVHDEGEEVAQGKRAERKDAHAKEAKMLSHLPLIPRFLAPNCLCTKETASAVESY